MKAGSGLSRWETRSTPRCLRAPSQGKTTSLKAALLDQRKVAGLGNIYICEALHPSHLSPQRIAATSRPKGEPTDRAKRLVCAIQTVLNDAIKAGGSSLRDHRQTTGELGYFQHAFEVYDREGEACNTPACGGTIKRFTQNGRSTFWWRNVRSDVARRSPDGARRDPGATSPWRDFPGFRFASSGLQRNTVIASEAKQSGRAGGRIASSLGLFGRMAKSPAAARAIAPLRTPVSWSRPTRVRLRRATCRPRPR